MDVDDGTSLVEVIEHFGPAVLLSAESDEHGSTVDFRARFVNTAFARMVDHPVDDLVGRSMLTLFPSTVEQGIFDGCREVAANGGSFAVETSWVDDGGARGYFEVSISPLGSDLLAVVREVTSDRQLADLRALADLYGEAVLSVGADGLVRMWGRSAQRMYGYTEEEVLGRPVESFAAEEWSRREVHAVLAVLGGRRAGPLRVEHRRMDGTSFPCEVSVFPVLDHDGRVEAALVIHRDLWAEMAVRDASPAAIISLDRNRRVTAWNPAAERMFGWSEHEALGRFLPIVPPEGRPDFIDRGRRQLEVATDSRVSYVRRDGTSVEARLSTNPLRGPDGRAVGVVGIIEDLTEQLHLQRDLAAERLERRIVASALAGVRRGPTTESTATAVCAAAVGIDGIEGAAVLHESPGGELRVLGARIDGALRGVPDAPPPGAAPVIAELSGGGPWAADVQGTVARTPLGEQLRGAGVTSIGGAPIEWDGQRIAQLVCLTSHPGGLRSHERRLAVFREVAVHAAALLGPQLSQDRVRAAMRAHLRSVIDRGDFWPVYQPWVDLATGDVVGYEALTRFADHRRPDLVFREAAAVGLLHDLERACLRAALAGMDDATVALSLNVTPSLALSGALEALLADRRGPLVLEVTEHVEIPDYQDLSRALRRIPDARVAVDDAGAGYASLHHVLELRPDVVKLDIGLIRGIDGDRTRQAMVAGMRHFADGTGTVLLAEGVETPAEAAALRSIGIELAQGYLFGRPERTPRRG